MQVDPASGMHSLHDAQICYRLDGQTRLLEGLPNSRLTGRLPRLHLPARKLPQPLKNPSGRPLCNQPKAAFFDQCQCYRYPNIHRFEISNFKPFSETLRPDVKQFSSSA